MKKTVIKISNIEGKSTLGGLVGFSIASCASDSDFNMFVKIARALREASNGKIKYDGDLKANVIESSKPDSTMEFFRKSFAEKYRSKFGENYEVIVETVQEKSIEQIEEEIQAIQNIDFSAIESNIELIEKKYLAEEFRLRKHQKEALAFTLSGKKVYLAYEPGTGKSLTYFVTLLYLHHFRELKNMLLVCPAAYGSSINIYEEFKKYGNEYTKSKMNLEVFAGNKNKVVKRFIENKNELNIFIISYETIRTSGLDVVKNDLNIAFDFIVCDEAKALINGGSKQGKAIREVINYFGSRWVQFGEGTPIRGYADDLHNPLDILQPGEWSSYWGFRKKYCQTKEVTVKEGKTIEIVCGVKNALELNKRLKTVMLTKRLEDLEDVPPVVFIRLNAEITNKKHLGLLKNIKTEFRDWYKNYMKTKKDRNVRLSSSEDDMTVKRTQILRLYQATTNPRIFDSSIKYEDIEQMNILKEYVEEAVLGNKKKAVIFTKFRESTEMISKMFEELFDSNKDYKGLKVINYLHGDKLENRTTFQNDSSAALFVTTVDSGGVAITLTSADTAIFYEKPQTWVEVFQALRRLQRIGQKEKVKVVSIVAKNTISESIEKKLARKKDGADKVLRGESDVIEEDIINDLEEFLKELNDGLDIDE